MSNLLKSKILLGVMIVAVMFVGFAVSKVHATECDLGTVTLRQGSTGEAVECLQSKVGATVDGKFGPMTKAKVMAKQSELGLTADGVVGALTRAALAGVTPTPTADLCPNGMTLASNCTTAPTATGTLCPNGNLLSNNCAAATTTGTVGVGTVDTYSLISSLNNEKVGEGTDDVKVYGLDIEVGEGSDLSLTAAKLVFNESTGATSNFKDYADEVSVWLGSTKIGTVTADKFTDDNAWTYTVGLSNAKILANTTGKLYVTVSGANNLDTNDAGDAWTLDITSIRWVDGQGAMISEDPATATRSFTFETSATASNMEFKISADDANVNDAHIIDVHATDDTQNVPILSFKVKVEGTSDIMLKDIPVQVNVTTASNVDDMINGLTLYMDGNEVASSNMAVDCNGDAAGDADCVAVGADETYVFHDIDTNLDAGGTYHFLVKADFQSIADALNAGDGINAVFGETQTDLATFDAEDSTGTNLVDADKTGTATGSTSIVRDSGINVKLVTAKWDSTAAGGSGTGNPDLGTYSITFDVTAFGADMWVDGTKPTLAGTDGIDLGLNAPSGGTGTIDSEITSSTGAVMSNTQNTTATFKVAEGETERFTITTIVTPTGAGGLYSVKLSSLSYGAASTDITDATAAAGTTFEYVTNLTDFVTNSANLKLTN